MGDAIPCTRSQGNDHCLGGHPSPPAGWSRANGGVLALGLAHPKELAPQRSATRLLGSAVPLHERPTTFPRSRCAAK